MNVAILSNGELRATGALGAVRTTTLAVLDIGRSMSMSSKPMRLGRSRQNCRDGMILLW